MRTLKIFLAALVVSLGVTGAKAENTVVAQMPVDDSFVNWGSTWRADAGRGGVYEARIKITEIDGMVALCGVGYLSNQRLRRANASARRGTFLTYDGQEILRDFSFFATVRSEEALDTATANCALTTLRAADSRGGRFDIGNNRSRFPAG